jgi:hypothetical protein
MLRGSLILNILADHQSIGRGRRGGKMAIKNVVIPLEDAYLQSAAKERGISRTKLVRVIMQKIIREELVAQLVDNDDLKEPRQQRYRRFRETA